MKLHYLGTAAAEGWPALFCHCEYCERAREAGGKNLRSRPQVLINQDLLMDFGPDTFYHAMQYQLDMAAVRNVLLTHSHTDHFYSTELILRALPYAYDGDKNPLTLYGNGKCRAMYQRTLEVEDDSQNLTDCIGFTEIRAFESLTCGEYQVLPLRARHDPAEECLIYIIREKDGSCLLYGNDTGFFPDETWDALKGCHLDLVSLDCTMGGTPDCTGHMGLDGALRTRDRLLQMGCANEQTTFVFTHFSHNGGLLHSELEDRVRGTGVLIAYDGLTLER